MKTKRIRFISLATIFACVLALLTVLLSLGLGNHVTASALTDGDYLPNVYFDYQQYAKNNNYTYVSMNNAEWDSDYATERTVYVLYKTSKKARYETLSSITAQHVKGYTTTLGVSADYLTEQETLRTFGVESTTKIVAVVGKIGGGTKWGDAESRTISREGEKTIPATSASGMYTLTASAYVYEYYLHVYKVTRDVNKDKDGNVTGHSNYAMTVDYDLSGTFESFDLQNGVGYTLKKG